MSAKRKLKLHERLIVPDLVIPLKDVKKLEPLPEEKAEEHPVKGREMTPDLFTAVAIIGKVKSGKTTAIIQALLRWAGYTTDEIRSTIIVFSSTWHNDPKWDLLRKECAKRRIPVIGYTSIFDDETGEDLVRSIMDMQKAQAEKDRQTLANWESGNMNKEVFGRPIGGGWGIVDPDEPRPFLPMIDPFLTAEGERYPQYIVILDDLAKEIHKPVVGELIRTYRHWRIKVVISSQHFVDPNTETRANVREWVLFKGLNKHKLKTIYEACTPDISLERFIKRYTDANSEPYRPLVVNVDRGYMNRGLPAQATYKTSADDPDV